MITRPLFFIVVIIAFAHILNTKLSSFPRSENQNKDLFWSAIVCTVLVACTCCVYDYNLYGKGLWHFKS